MKPDQKYSFKISLLMFLCGLSTTYVAAQKLPRVQQISLRAPENIKIDGKTSDWHNQFQADNPACRLLYTIANDDQNLYVVIRMKGIYGNAKVLQGGITFTLKPTEKSSGLKDVSITFPSAVTKYDAKREHLKIDQSNFYDWNLDRAKDTLINKRVIDSLVSATNAQIIDLFKEIQVDGIQEIATSSISINNNKGILAAARFDNMMKYTYELAIPLKYLKTAINSGKLKYNIKLKSAKPVMNQNPNVLAPPVAVGADGAPVVNYDMEYLNGQTDFSGEYTLSEK